jgi:hypothetical protein
MYSVRLVFGFGRFFGLFSLAQGLKTLGAGPGSPVSGEFGQKFPAVGLGDALAPPADPFGLASLVPSVVERPEAVWPLAVLAVRVFPVAQISPGVYPSGHGRGSLSSRLESGQLTTFILQIFMTFKEVLGRKMLLLADNMAIF